jgi:CheY-like chemotaxis protein
MENFEILIIDDDSIFLMLQKKILVSEGVIATIKTFSEIQVAYDYIKSSDICTTLFSFFGY